MSIRTWSTLFIAGLVVASAHSANAVNCDQVRRYLSTGRSAEDIAESMIVSLDEVKKCQQAGTGEQKGEPKGDATPAQGKPAGN